MVAKLPAGQCFERKTVASHKEYAQSRMEGQRLATLAAKQARLKKVSQEIASIESQIKNNAPAMATSANELRARLATLKAEEAQLISIVGSSTTVTDPLAGFEESEAPAPAAAKAKMRFQPQ